MDKTLVITSKFRIALKQIISGYISRKEKRELLNSHIVSKGVQEDPFSCCNIQFGAKHQQKVEQGTL